MKGIDQLLVNPSFLVYSLEEDDWYERKEGNRYS